MPALKYPCRNCVYFKTCGSTTRTEVCHGRMTATQAKKAREKAERDFLQGK